MVAESFFQRLGLRSNSRRANIRPRIGRLVDRAVKSACEPLETRLLLTAITTYHVNNQSTGVNNTETLLTPANVNVNTFGKLFSTPVIGQVYAEPLYVPGVNITAGAQTGVHNVVYVATEHNMLYAIDSTGGNVLWSVSFLDTTNATINPLGASTITPMNSSNSNSGDLTPEIGITATPVIDQPNGFIYLLAKSQQIVAGAPDGTLYAQIFYKVDIHSGAVVASTVVGETVNNNGNYTYVTTGAAAGTPYVIGTGDGKITVNNQSRVYFNAQREFSRAGMTLVNGVVYMGFASHGDNGPYHGWMLGFSTSSMAIVGALNTTPNGGLGGIWQGGGSIVTDPQGFFYFETGNGSFNQSTSNFNAGSLGLPHDGDYGDSFLKVAIDTTTSPTNQNINGWGLKVVDFFSPANNNQLSGGDVDVGSGGPTILPDAVGSAAHPHLLIGAGKEGKLYLIDRDNMGGFTTSTDRAVQEVGSAITGLLNEAAFFLNNPAPATGSPSGTLLIVEGYGGGEKAFSISNGVINSTFTSQNDANFGSLSGSPTVSANGTNNAILWGIARGAGILYAYDANNLSTELWDSAQAANNRDQLVGGVVKFSVPTVADGQVFVGTSTSLVVYGPPAPPTSAPAAPTNLAATSPAYNTVNLSWVDKASNEDSYLIERTTTPGDANSWVQIGTTSANATTYSDITALATTTYSYRVRAHNLFNGNSYSAYTNTAAATTPQAPPLGTGDGAFAQYWNDTGGVHFSGTPALTRVDPTINFNYGAGGPGTPIGVDNFSATWSGRIQPQFSETYTFYTQSDDGVLLEIRPAGTQTWTVLVNNLTDHGSTENNGAYAVSAGAQYDFLMEYYEGAGSAIVQLSWSSDHTPKHIIPTSQIYSGAAPATPTNLTVTPQASYEIDLAWNDIATNETGYQVERSDPSNPFTVIQSLPPGSNSFIDSGLLPGVNYSYRVRAINFNADSLYSNVASLTTPVPPNKPTNAHPTSVTTNSIAMAWTDTSDNEDGFRVLRSGYVPGQQEDNFNTIAILPANTQTFTDSGQAIPISPGSEYDYHILAYNLGGVNDFTGFTTETITLAPTNLAAIPGNAQVGLTWTAPNFNSSNPSDLTFNVYRTTNANGTGAAKIGADIETASFTDLTAVNGTTYYYTVTATDLGGESAKSNQVSAAPTGQQTGFVAHINFQDTTSAGYPGYLADTGLAYADRGNGFTYGWNIDNTANARNRNMPAQDERYDTLAHMQKTPGATTWEIAVPNGTYSVHIVSGDSTAIDSIFKINAENVLVVNGTPTNAVHWIEGTAAQVVVADGKLTITNAAGSSNNKIDYIDITAVTNTDNTPPTVTAKSPAAGATITSSATNINVTFSEPVTGVDASDLVLTGAGAASASVTTPTNIGGNTWRFPVTGLLTGTVNVSLAPDANDIKDLANNNLAPVAWSFTANLSAQPFSAHINFQDTTSAGYPGYLADTGLIFGDRGNGLFYGWNIDNSINARNRNMAAQDERYDTLAHMQKTPGATTWEIAVPNGTYSVHIASGDSTAIDSIFKINAENVLVVNGTPNNNTHWIEGTAQVVVSDGRLTITNAPGSSNNKIDYIDITAVNSNDNTPPTVTAKIPAAGSTVTTSAVNIDVTFSEPVTGVDASDLVLTGAGAASAAKGTPTNIGGNTWRFPVTGLVSGTVNVSLAPDANDIEDAAGNNLAPVAWSFTANLSAQPFSAHINFQDTTSAGYPGYLADTGLAFGDRGNGLSYGWNIDNSINARNRNVSFSADERYDTLIHMQKGGGATVWEIAVPNGTYTVHIAAGDASNIDSVFRINAEGVLAVSGTPNDNAHWVEGTVTVTVSDGRLTITNAPGSSNNKIDYIDITAAP